MKVEIYSRPGCGYCDAAKDIFKDHGVHYIEYGVGSGISKEEFYEKFPGCRTVPQIVIDGKHIGGYGSLTEWIEHNDFHS